MKQAHSREDAKSAVFVVTRPAPGHESLMQELAARGLSVLHNPGFRLESEPRPRLERRLAELPKFDLAIVTSPTAARLVTASGPRTGIGNVRVVVPGRGTASILEQAGISADFPEAGGTSEHILAMTEARDIHPERVAIVGAPGGRSLIAREFSRRGAEVAPIHLYRRVPVAPNPSLVDALEQGADLVNLISSGQALQTILAGLPAPLREAWLASLFVVSSKRLAAACRDAGVHRLRIASGASDEAMLTAALRPGEC